MTARHKGLRPCTAEEALARLVAGNERFINGRARFPTVQKEILAELAKGQRPYATIVGCSDSRVPPELVFDASFGELFIVRVAGNVVSAEIMGTLQYGAVHLHTPLFVVLGHEGCGAVQAALAYKYRAPASARASRYCSRRFCPASKLSGQSCRSLTNFTPPWKRTCAGRCTSCWIRLKAKPEWLKASSSS